MPITKFISKITPKFVCDECGYGTHIKSRLVNHVNNAHLKINNEPSYNQSEDTSLVPLISAKSKTPRAKRKAETELSPSNPKRISLSIERKKNIIESYDALPKMSQGSAADMLKIPRASLRLILSNRETIMASDNSDMKRLRVGKDVMVENCLIKWFDTVREKNAILSHEMLREKAEDLAKKLGHDDFKATPGWLQRLLKRSGIDHKKQHGEAQSSDFQGMTDWLKDIWPDLHKKYKKEDIFNCDETGLFFRMIPNGTLAFKHDKRKGTKKVKDRITVLVTASMMGEKKTPFIIGKSAKPRCFKNIKSFPCDYTSQNKAWDELYKNRSSLKIYSRRLPKDLFSY